jgi:hypothetical protein
LNNPQTNAIKPPYERTLTDPKDLSEMAPSTIAPPSSLVEAYKKHATELASIEDRQYKLTLLMLGIFSAGLTLIASGHVDLTCSVRWSLIAFSLAIVIPSCQYIGELHHLRGVTRELLVRCEIALGFHSPDLFLKDENLYAAVEMAYGKKGQYLRNSFYLLVLPACLAFVLIVAFVRVDSASAGHNNPCADGILRSATPSQQPAPQK